MNPDTNPNHRPHKWARLKAKLRQERAEADRLNTQLQWAHLFIAKTGRWQDFEQWLTQEATDSNDTAKLTDSVCTYFVQALNQAQAEADQAKHRLTVAQMMGNTYAEQKTAYYKMIETQTLKLTACY